MTDMITVSRKEIEALFRRAVKGNIFHSELKELLDKAEVSEPVAIPTAPEKIWLNIGDTDLAEIKENNWQWNELSEITWCQDKIDQCDIPYIRADLAYTAPPDQSAKIAELEAEVSRLNAIIDDIKTLDNVFGVDDKKITSGMVLRAQTAPSISDVIDEYKKDAERYRWLKERDLDTINNGGVFAGMTPHNLVLNGYDLDEAIDLAMKATNDK